MKYQKYAIKMNEKKYKTMWIIAMFDLPTETPADKREYRKFREFLLDDGFIMLQYSVYARHCGSQDNTRTHSNRVVKKLPLDGEVRIIELTSKQFASMKIFWGKKSGVLESEPTQYLFL